MDTSQTSITTSRKMKVSKQEGFYYTYLKHKDSGKNSLNKTTRHHKGENKCALRPLRVQKWGLGLFSSKIFFTTVLLQLVQMNIILYVITTTSKTVNEAVEEQAYFFPCLKFLWSNVLHSRFFLLLVISAHLK